MELHFDAHLNGEIRHRIRRQKVRASRTILSCLLFLLSQNCYVHRSCAAETVAADVTITPRGSSAEDAFEQLRKKGLRAELLGPLRLLVVPSELRFKPVPGRELVEAMAKFRGRKVSWLNGGTTAVILRGADEADVRRFLEDIRSEIPAVRADAAWRAGWMEDVRVVPPLAVAAMDDKDKEVSEQAMRSLARLGWPAVGAIAPDAAIDPLEKALADQNGSVHSSTTFALGSVGGERALALLEKALANQDAIVREHAADALWRVGGEKARDLLLKRLAEEKDGNVIETISSSLREKYGGDPEVDKALKEAEARQPAPAQPIPVPPAVF